MPRISLRPLLSSSLAARERTLRHRWRLLQLLKPAGQALRQAGFNAATPYPLAGASSWAAPVPAWLFVFAAGLGAGLGLCLGLLLH